MACAVWAMETLVTEQPALKRLKLIEGFHPQKAVRCREERPGCCCGARAEPRCDVPHACGVDQVWGDRNRDPRQGQGSPATPGDTSAQGSFSLVFLSSLHMMWIETMRIL